MFEITVCNRTQAFDIYYFLIHKVIFSTPLELAYPFQEGTETCIIFD